MKSTHFRWSKKQSYWYTGVNNFHDSFSVYNFCKLKKKYEKPPPIVNFIRKYFTQNLEVIMKIFYAKPSGYYENILRKTFR